MQISTVNQMSPVDATQRETRQPKADVCMKCNL